MDSVLWIFAYTALALVLIVAPVGTSSGNAVETRGNNAGRDQQ